MPFSTGTAVNSTDLLKKINTHLVANGWTKLRGEEDIVPASPKSARYWRMIVLESQTTSATVRGVQLFNLRGTPGGPNLCTNAANFTISDLGTGNASLLISGGVVRSSNIGSARAWRIQYDFGSPTIIRELYMRADSTVGNTPRSFVIQWSHDGEVWTTMFDASNISWTASEFKTFTWNDGYVSPIHPSSTIARRSGSAEDFPADVNWEGSGFRHMSEDMYAWQAPGYDANRRVYVKARSHSVVSSSTEIIEWNFSAAYNNNLRGFFENVGTSPNSTFHFFGTGTISYRIYSNSKRLILITKTGATDYTSSYVGFLSAFALPDYYPFPLTMSATSPSRSAYNLATSDNVLSSMADPGFGCIVSRYWDGIIRTGGNRAAGATDGYTVSGTSSPFPFVWPHFFGKSTSNERWPNNRGGGTTGTMYSNQTLMEKLIATQQNDLPLFPAIVIDHQYGSLGALDGVFILPGWNILAAEQTMTINSVNYRIFPNRTRRLGASWFAVRED
jgi:hypothetical protein